MSYLLVLAHFIDGETETEKTYSLSMSPIGDKSRSQIQEVCHFAW